MKALTLQSRPLFDDYVLHRVPIEDVGYQAED